jgi:hypothetical protein
MVPGDVASLMMQRNGLAAHLARGTLPPMLRDPSPRGCGRCFALNTCSIAHKVITATKCLCQQPWPRHSYAYCMCLRPCSAASRVCCWKMWAGLVRQGPVPAVPPSGAKGWCAPAGAGGGHGADGGHGAGVRAAGGAPGRRGRQLLRALAPAAGPGGGRLVPPPRRHLAPDGCRLVSSI